MNYLNYLDKKKRLNYYKKEHLILLLKSCFFDCRLSFNVRFFVRSKNYKKIHIQKNSLVKIRNRCVLTGRSRFVLSSFGLSRASAKMLLGKGYISGYKRK